MIYNVLPIIDIFRKIDEDTVIGAMDSLEFEETFLFYMKRIRKFETE